MSAYTDNADLDRTPLTTEEAGALVGVPASRIRDWKRRGLLAPAATLDGRPAYLGIDVMRVERATRQSSKSRRR